MSILDALLVDIPESPARTKAFVAFLTRPPMVSVMTRPIGSLNHAGYGEGAIGMIVTSCPRFTKP